ncbi:hypothetical protein [Streptomyces chartreusis]|uniref:hypothetical protein n=1 Tax=Streptomyces chartreusis TaxID=1969 RepID=UPI003D753DBC
MTITLAAAPSPAHDVARWVLTRLGPELWELDGLLDTAILRNRHGHEILIRAAGGELTLAAQVNIADNDDVPLTTIREVQPLPTGPSDPVVSDLLDAIRYRLAPAYGRQNVTQAAAVLAAPLLATPGVSAQFHDDEWGHRATIDIGRLQGKCHRVSIAHVWSKAPSVGLRFEDLSLRVAQELVRAALIAEGHTIPTPREVAPHVLKDMLDVARGDAPPETVTASVADPETGAAPGARSPVHGIGDLVAEVVNGPECRVNLWFGRLGVERATTILYAYTCHS